MAITIFKDAIAYRRICRTGIKIMRIQQGLRAVLHSRKSHITSCAKGIPSSLVVLGLSMRHHAFSNSVLNTRGNSTL